MTTKIAETTIYSIPLTSTMKQMAGRVQTNDKKPLAKSPIADRITAISSLRSTVSNVFDGAGWTIGSFGPGICGQI